MVNVHVFDSPRATVISPSSPQSPLNPTNVYPGSRVSPAVYVPGLTGTATPDETGLSFKVSKNSLGRAKPPSSFMTLLTTVMYAC